MQLLGNIQRVQKISKASFELDYLERRTPLIIEGLFQSTLLEKLSNIEAVRSILGRMQLRIGEEFGTTMLRETKTVDPVKSNKIDISPSCSLNEYFSFIVKHPDTRKMASVNEVPSMLSNNLPIPYLCANSRELPTITRLFVGNAGNNAHLHYDSDGRDVFLSQVFGRKRVVIIPIEQTEKLLPIRNFSSIYLENFSTSEKINFLKYVDAKEAILHPGDTIFMPKACWHYVEYIDTGMSIGYRFLNTPNRFIKFLAEKIYPNRYWQGMIAQFSDETQVVKQYLSEFLKIAVSRLFPYKSSEIANPMIHERMRSAYQNICIPNGKKIQILSQLEDFENTLFSKNNYYRQIQNSRRAMEKMPTKSAKIPLNHFKDLLKKYPLLQKTMPEIIRECFRKKSINELNRFELYTLDLASEYL